MTSIIQKIQTTNFTETYQNNLLVRYFRYFLIGLGSYQLYGFIGNIMKRTWYHYLAPNPDLLKRYGQCYVMITGGSQGLGREFAKVLARKGFNIILIARGKEQLEQVKNEIYQINPNVDVVLRQFDFSNVDPSNYDQLIESLIDYDIGLVLNNVGTFGMDLLPDMTHEKLIGMLNVNIFASTLITQRMIPKLKLRHKKSALIFVGSEAGDYPRSRFSVYASTKAYGNHLARSLEIELRRSNIEVYLFLPGPTLTPLLNLASPDYPNTIDGRFFLCQAHDVAEALVRKIPRQKIIQGTFKHGLLHFILRKYRGIYDLIKND